MKVWMLGWSLLMLAVGATALAAEPATAPPALDDFVRHARFLDVKLSPTGEYLAASTMATEDTGALVVLRRADLRMTGSFRLKGKTFVDDFFWANDERIVFTVIAKDGPFTSPRPQGVLFATNWDGKQQTQLTGDQESVDLVDTLRDDDEHVLVSVIKRVRPDGVYPSLQRLQIYNKSRAVLARAPVANASYLTDRQGVARFASGVTVDNRGQVYCRDDADAEWRLINDEAAGDLGLRALAFTADDRHVLIAANKKSGPDALYEWDPATNKRELIARNDRVDPLGLVYAHDFSRAVGVVFMDGLPTALLLDPASREAQLWKSLSANFPGQWVSFRSFSKDASELVFRVSSDRNPGKFYLLDKDNQAIYLLSTRGWIDPERMATVKPIDYVARDGVTIHGYLTLPPKSAGKQLPLIVNPHGGPIGVYDDWFFNNEVQLLASRGYAVLQVNFRGSGHYGRAFEMAGYRQWGGAMIDDITDGTRWAIAQGVADPRRVCIYGASYGAYAAAQSLAREPELYRCAVGYVGVYDLPAMLTDGDAAQTRRGMNYLKETLGEDEDFLAGISPARHADKIKSPIFIAVGNDDLRAPPEHSRALRKALEQAGKTVQWMEKDHEGHGYFKQDDQREFYTAMLAWFDRYIGPKP